MKEAGEAHRINVLSFAEFAAIFFDFERYRTSREGAPFGSAINPLTGAKDDREYVPVTYMTDNSSREVDLDDIAYMIRTGRRVVLLGEYGSGKSRCIREIFKRLATQASEDFIYPIAIDLRECWGLRRASELVIRHVAELGLDSKIERSAIRALNAKRCALLLDGFDELGSQSWSNDSEKLRVIRSKSLEGVRNLVSRADGGMLIAGREHYFNGNAEMFAALGFDPEDSVVIRCKGEFSEKEMQEFFRRIAVDIVLPDWLPRRPLICQTIADMSEDDIDHMFGVGQDELSFWDHFIRVLCERDKRIHVSFDAATIERVLTYLARITRARPANVGPISLTDIQAAFESVVGQLPVEEASLMLQRLPGLGRVKAESNDRQFIDIYILDGLRAKDTGKHLYAQGPSLAVIVQTAYTNPLEELGQRILARDIETRPKKAVEIAKQAAVGSNHILACDLVAALMHTHSERVDFENLVVDDGNFIRLDLARALPMNLTISNTVFGTLVLPASVPVKTAIKNCLAERVIGVASPTVLPAWIEKLTADKYDSTESVSRIRQIGLDPAHEILVTVVRKTFFQKGSGRKEEALVRGLGQVALRTVPQIINLLLREDILTRFRGKEGEVYAPNRKFAGRMKQMLYELTTSNDPIWIEAGKLN
jgi:hypothetical protein